MKHDECDDFLDDDMALAFSQPADNAALAAAAALVCDSW
jgi:hypothetical protein